MSRLYCAIAECNNSRYKNVLSESEDRLSFHRFPKDQKIRKAWIQKCKRKDKFNVDNSYVCSAHFTKDDFKDDLKFRLMGGKRKAQLKDFVIPHKNIPLSISKEITARSRRAEEKKQKEEHEEIISKSLDPVKAVCGTESDESNRNFSCTQDVHQVESLDYKYLYEEERRKNEIIEKQLENAKEELNIYKRRRI